MELNDFKPTPVINPSFNPMNQPHASTFEEYNPFQQNFNPELQQKNNEVTSHFRNRKAVYENVLNELKDHEKAVCYSNMWSNKTYLGVKYSQELEDLIMKYAPKTNK